MEGIQVLHAAAGPGLRSAARAAATILSDEVADQGHGIGVIINVHDESSRVETCLRPKGLARVS